MAKKIQVLPKNISQVIAAGEVIERPASVVKELVENAIDAGSSEIIIELKAGGLQLIRINDNGEGIDPEDAPLAFQRYATSKMRGIEDLQTIHTLGFRGEAIPSIASVSEMTIKTRVANSISGIKVICEGGEIKNISEMGCPPGTEVEVKNIFYNIPVKRKFLKSIKSELRYSINYFLRLSLSHPSVSFSLIHDGRVLYELPQTESLFVRIETIFGKEIVTHLKTIEFEDSEIRISGFTSLPSISKGNADGIYLYVNRRFVRDRIVYKAILQAYRHLIPAGKFPITILWITIPPYAVDVNVHPTKAEVKFKDPERIFQAVHMAFDSVHEITLLKQPTPENEKDNSVYSLPPSISYPIGDHLAIKREDGGKDASNVSEAFHFMWGSKERMPFRILGQVKGTYILCEGEKGIVFIDQHAAHERILFEQYKEQYEKGALHSIKFLIPILMELSIEESFTLTTYSGEFQSMGFEIDPMGEKTYAIRTIPLSIEKKDPKRIIREILDELSFLKKGGKDSETIHTILITLACHSAIRGNFALRKEEMEELVKDLAPFNLSMTCPHGRPVFFSLPLEELSKQFKRN